MRAEGWWWGKDWAGKWTSSGGGAGSCAKEEPGRGSKEPAAAKEEPR